MTLNIVGKNDDVVQVDEAVSEIKISHAMFHQSLESCGGIAYPEGHTVALIKSQASNLKRSLLLIFFLKFHLPVSGVQV
ncbi:hypothetical protein DPMN_068087 [Dreissena polymorpha]|uniref:Uncharacterized protein n=1 Tax=Dreissena polymorpha TaxID=45954 RepID=A0A9D4BLW4_DREPO|nr:hypothetical protein DPMN_068087 [Dreissena polymorpha]